MKQSPAPGGVAAQAPGLLQLPEPADRSKEEQKQGTLGFWTLLFYVYEHFPWCPQRREEGIESPIAGVTDGYELQSGCWELKLGPPQEQP